MAQTLSTGGYIEAIAGAQNPIATSFWCKSSATSTNMQFFSRHSNASSANDGIQVYTNTAAGTTKMDVVSKSGSTIIINFRSTGTFRDGNWHHIGINYPQNSGQTVQLYLDGVADGSQTAASNHGAVSFPYRFGQGTDPFYGSFAGDFAEMAIWTTTLTADEFAALAKGFRPPNVKRNGLLYYVPGVRAAQDALGSTITTSGASASDHPRMY